MTKTTFTVKKEDLQVVLNRVFDATPEVIWKVISDPAMVPKWWGPAQYETVVDKMDFRVGGEWRFVQKDEGQDYAFHGVYKEIIPNEKVSDTFNFEPIGPGHELVETMVLEDIGDGKTNMTTTTVYQNIQDLEGMVNSGMEGGATETWERLATIVEKSN
jgi:uncharacterized protein YndB with AHSA1/START domain